MASRVQALISVFVLSFFAVECMHTVPELIPEAYAGRWYQAYSNRWADLGIQVIEPDCVSVDYGVINATFVSVYNANWLFDEKRTDDINGYAYIPDLNKPGQLNVVLEGVPVLLDYWIFKLGPIINGQYQYSLITDAEDSARPLFVLTRDLDVFAELYDQEVREYLTLHDYVDGFKAPYATFYNESCVFPPLNRN
nr:uncharacterized protein LOC129270105 [Lytechinus pictus]